MDGGFFPGFFFLDPLEALVAERLIKLTRCNWKGTVCPKPSCVLNIHRDAKHCYVSTLWWEKENKEHNSVPCHSQVLFQTILDIALPQEQLCIRNIVHCWYIFHRRKKKLQLIKELCSFNNGWDPLLFDLAPESTLKTSGRGRSRRPLSQQSTHTVLNAVTFVLSPGAFPAQTRSGEKACGA